MSSSFKKNRRDPGRFIQLPLPVLESAAYRALGFSARALMLDMAAQYMGKNNGQLLAGWTIMQTRGWRSKRTLIDAKRELLESGQLVVETRMGKFPSTSAWYGCTWWPLDWCEDMDMAVRDFPRGQYKLAVPVQNASLGAVSAPRPTSTGAVSVQGA
jgi:hypothetical protein